MRFGGFDDYDESRDVEDEGEEKYYGFGWECDLFFCIFGYLC